MKAELKENWYKRAVDPSMSLDAAGIYQWSIEGVGIYVGKAKVLRTRLLAYPRNVVAMLEGRHWHGNPLKDYRDIHKALRDAHNAGTPVAAIVLEVCDPAIRAERERHWIRVRREEHAQGGPKLLNSN